MSNIDLFEPSQKHLKELDKEIYSILIKNEGLEDLVKELKENDLPTLRLLAMKHIISDNARTVEALNSLKDAICKTPEVGSMPVYDAYKFLNDPSLIYGEIKKREQDMETILTEMADVKYCLPTAEIISKTTTYTAMKNELVALTQLANSVAAAELQDNIPTPKPLSLRERIKNAMDVRSADTTIVRHVYVNMDKETILKTYNDGLPNGISPETAATVNSYNTEFRLGVSTAFADCVKDESDKLSKSNSQSDNLEHVVMVGKYQMPDETTLNLETIGTEVEEDGRVFFACKTSGDIGPTDELSKSFIRAMNEVLG